MVNNDRKKAGYIICLGIALFVLCLLSLCAGSAKLTPTEFFKALSDIRCKTPYGVIVYSVRLPRILAGVVAGIGLGLSGAVLQTVTGNKMASPNLIGVNSGAGFAVIIVLSFFPQLFRLLPLFAFVGAFAATLVIAALSKRLGMTKGTLILTGLAISSVLTSGISLMAHMNSDVLVMYNGFSVGSLSGVGIDELVLPSAIVVISLILVLILSGRMDILSLGDVTAHSLGVCVSRTRFFALVAASAGASAAVSFAGLLGFAGLMAPHIARRLVGSKTALLVPASAVTGAFTVVLADTLGRTVFAPSEIPVGIITALVGAPFFLFLLFTKGGRENA